MDDNDDEHDEADDTTTPTCTAQKEHQQNAQTYSFYSQAFAYTSTFGKIEKGWEGICWTK